MNTAVSVVRVAVVQFDPQVGTQHGQINLENSLDLALQAALNGATLIVLPELANTGYLFANRQDAYEHAEPIPEGPSVQAWIDFAEQHQVYLVAGLAERDGMQLFDTAVLLGPGGFIGKYRKAHLWNREKLWFTPGDLGFPVFETPIGRIGLLICWDIWFPEVPRLLSLQGADIICSLNNWVWTPPPLLDEAGKCMASYLTMTAAHVNNVFIAAANRIGEEHGERYLGCSLIAGTNGWPIGTVAPVDEQTILYADIDLSTARSAPIIAVTLSTAAVGVYYSAAGAGYWPGCTEMMSSLPSPLAWLRWVVGDISEVAFYKHEFASLGLLLGGALGYWASRYAKLWQGFSISYGTGLWPWLVTSSLLGLLLSNALWGWTLTADTWQPTFAALVSLPAAMVLMFSGGWKVTLNGAILGALLVTLSCLLIVPLDYPSWLAMYWAWRWAAWWHLGCAVHCLFWLVAHLSKQQPILRLRLPKHRTTA